LYVGVLRFKLIDAFQNFPAPQSNGITTFQIPNPIKHHFHSSLNLRLKFRPAELGSYISQHWVMSGHMYDNEDAKEILRPAE
jgi:hypothetical protein